MFSFTPDPIRRASHSEQRLLSVSPGPDERDGAFMQRLRNLVHEASDVATSGGEAAAGVGCCAGAECGAHAGAVGSSMVS